MLLLTHVEQCKYTTNCAQLYECIEQRTFRVWCLAEIQIKDQNSSKKKKIVKKTLSFYL